MGYAVFFGALIFQHRIGRISSEKIAVSTKLKENHKKTSRRGSWEQGLRKWTVLRWGQRLSIFGRCKFLVKNFE